MEEIRGQRQQAAICEKVFEIMRTSVEIMDEVDIILHPLKSELNWPLGAKEPLDFTRSRQGNGLRWSVPSHLLDAIFTCCGMPIVADVADSRVAVDILEKLDEVIKEGCDITATEEPHLALVSKNFYDSKMRSVLCEWMVLWLRAKKLPVLEDSEIMEFLVKGQASNANITARIKQHLGDDHTKMLNLSHDWVTSFLPFVYKRSIEYPLVSCNQKISNNWKMMVLRSLPVANSVQCLSWLRMCHHGLVNSHTQMYL